VHSAYHAEREVTTAAGAIAEAAAPACSACSWWRKQNVPIASMALSVHVDLESPLVEQIRAPFAADRRTCRRQMREGLNVEE
jgi:hypothetical protein